MPGIRQTRRGVPEGRQENSPGLRPPRHTATGLRGWGGEADAVLGSRPIIDPRAPEGWREPITGPVHVHCRGQHVPVQAFRFLLQIITAIRRTMRRNEEVANSPALFAREKSPTPPTPLPASNL